MCRVDCLLTEGCNGAMVEVGSEVTGDMGDASAPSVTSCLEDTRWSSALTCEDFDRLCLSEKEKLVRRKGSGAHEFRETAGGTNGLP